MAGRAAVFLFCTVFALTSPVIGQICCEPVGHWGYGATWVTAWYGELAVIGSGPKLLVADFRLDAPQAIVGEVRLPGEIKAIVVEGEIAYVGVITAVTAPGDLVAIVDLTDPNRPVMIGSFGVSRAFADLAVQNDVVYATSLYEGLVTFDVSDPSRPQRLAALSNIGYPAAIEVRGDFAYFGSGTHLAVVYIIDPAAPILVHEDWLGEYARKLAISGTFLYHLSEDRLSVFDLAIPWRPTPRGDIETPGGSQGLDVVGDTVYLTDRMGVDLMIVVDAADPDSLEQLAAYPTEHPAWNVAATDGAVLLSMDTLGAQLVDVTDPSAPQLFVELPPPAPVGDMVDVEVDRGLAFLADEGYSPGSIPPVGRLRVIDVSQGPPFVEAARLELPMPASRVAAYGNYLLLTRGQRGMPLNLDVIDTAAPGSPEVVGTLRLGGLSWGDIAVSGHHAYITDALLRSVDLSDPTQPTLVASTYGSGGYRYGIDVEGDSAYLAADDRGLCIVDVADPADPVELSCTPAGRLARWLAVRDGLAFMTVEPEEPKPEWEDELRVYDLNDDLVPVEIASVGLWGGAGRVSIDGDLAFVGAIGRGLLTFDISNPALPVLVGISPDDVSGIGSDGRLYALAGHHGMDVLGTSDCAVPLPQPDFRWAPTNPTLGEEIVFTDISAGAPDSWDWDFGDGGSSQEQHPQHSFSNPGRTTVALTAGNQNGSSSSNRTVIVQSIADPMVWRYIVPAAAHIDGQEDTEWTSDLVLHSDSAGTDAVLYFMEQGEDNTLRHGQRVTLPRGSTAIDDVVAELFDEDAGSGAIFITSDRALGVSSRTSTASGEGSFGQHIPAVDMRYPGSFGNTLIGLTQNDDFRTNLGLVNRLGTTTEVTAYLFAADSFPIAAATYTVEPFGHLQINGFIEDLSDEPLDDGYVHLLGGGSGSGFLAYASVVDNRTGDPSFILPPQFGYDESLWIPAVAHAPGRNGTVWRTDLEVCSVANVDATFRIELLKSDQANPEPASETFNLSVDHCARYTDVVQSVFGETTTGALRIVPESGFIAASSRTSTRRADGGTYGQFVGAVADRDAAVSFPARLILQLHQSADLDTGFRTNIGLLSTSDNTIEVTMWLHSADDELLQTTEIELRPFEHRQLNRPFHGISHQDIENAMVVFSSSYNDTGYIAYASVVDNVTGDAVFQPVQ